MNDKCKSRRKLVKRLVAGFFLLVVVATVSGCHTLGFYSQAVRGQYQIIANEQRIDKLLAGAQTPAQLKGRLELLQRLRVFAKSNLKLPTDHHYEKYTDLRRPFVVWNVEAAPEFSLQPKSWWYPLVGSLEYRGYFTHAGATNYARSLRNDGYDVSVGGVQAYSTLGWFEDPVLNTFIFESDAELAEIIFHELGHQRLFAHGDTDFNEAFATTVGEEGARRWLQTHGDAATLQQYQAHLDRNMAFVHLVMSTRARLAALYGDVRGPDGKLKASRRLTMPAEELRRQKAQIFQQMATQFQALRKQWGGDPEFDGWFKHPINNAQLNSVAAYYDFVPGFEQLLANSGGDMEKFYQAAETLSKKPKPDRHRELKALSRLRVVAALPAQKRLAGLD
jgi:predicted aminopeptidase